MVKYDYEIVLMVKKDGNLVNQESFRYVDFLDFVEGSLLEKIQGKMILIRLLAKFAFTLVREYLDDAIFALFIKLKS